MAKIKITISASAVDSALSNEVVPLLSSAVDATNRAAILAGSGWRAFSDQACTSQIGLKEVYTSATAFRYDVAAASLSALSDTDIYLEDGNGAVADIDPYPAAAETFNPLIEDFADKTSNANNGTGVGGIAAGGVTGPDGVLPATDFDGVDDGVYLDVATNSEFFTMSCWIKADALGAYDSIVQYIVGGAVAGLLLSGATGNPLTARWENLTTEFNAATGLTVLTDGTWAFAAVVFTSSSTTVYLNASSASISTSGNSVVNFSDLRIGIDPQNISSRIFNGGIAGVGIQTRTRPAASLNLEYLLTGPDAATYITAQNVTFNPAWAAQSNVLIGGAA